MREVAGEEAAAAVGLAEVDGDGVFAGEHGGVGCGFVVSGGADSVSEDGQAGDGDGDGGGIERNACIACGGDEASPVGIAGGPGSLAERRMRDGAGDGFGFGIGARASDLERDDVGDAFAIVNDGVGKRLTDLAEKRQLRKVGRDMLEVAQ